MKNEHLLGPLRVAAKAGFVTRRIFNEFFVNGQDRTWHFRRWQQLTKSGYFIRVPDYGFVKSAVTLSQEGRRLANRIWNESVYCPPAKNLWHDEELIRFALFLERHGWLSNWMTEMEMKSSDLHHRFFQNQVRASKIPDLILSWKTQPKPILWAVELERTRKEPSRYYEMVGAYKGISQVESVLVIVAEKSIEQNIKRAQAKMNYPESQRPMFFASMNQVIESPLSCELRSGPNRMALGKFAKALTGTGAIEPRSPGQPTSNMVSNNVASETVDA